MAGPHTARARARTQMLDDIKREALRQLAADGAAGLSLRAVARELGVVSSGLYRYYANRDELLTALIVDAYDDLAGAITRAVGGVPGPEHRLRWIAACGALRQWAGQQPARFSLLYGSPVPGYRAPGTTIEPATRVIVALLGGLADAARDGALAARPEPAPTDLREQLTAMAAGLKLDLPPGPLVRAVGAFAELIGLITLELGGHFVGGFEPADTLFAHSVADLADRVGLGE